MSPNYVWIPSNQNEKSAFMKKSLLEAIKAIAVADSYHKESLPKGRVMFVDNYENRIFIDEKTLFDTVNNSNLTEIGLEKFLYSKKVNSHISYIRFPMRGHLLEILHELPNQDTLWFHVNTSSVRDDFSHTVSYVEDENLSTSLYNCSRMNHVYNVIEDGSTTAEEVHLICDEIPTSLRYIEQSGNQWHKADNRSSNKKYLMMKMLNNKILSAFTTPLTMRYLALVSISDIQQPINELKVTFENLSMNEQKMIYTNLYSILLDNHRADFEFIGKIHWIHTENIVECSENNVIII